MTTLTYASPIDDIRAAYPDGTRLLTSDGARGAEVEWDTETTNPHAVVVLHRLSDEGRDEGDLARTGVRQGSSVGNFLADVKNCKNIVLP